VTWLLAVLAGWAAWRLIDRPLPQRRLVALSGGQGDMVSGRGRGLRAGPAPGGLAQRRRRTRSDELPDLAASVDLLAVAVSGGYSLHGAVRVAGTEGEGPVADALGRVAADFDRGVPLADSLAVLPRELGPGAAALSTTLSVAAVSGTPLGPALQRLADAERRRYRRAVEARARRLPVLLLGPLVGLVLPAFVVLTIVPAALSSVVSRPLPGTSLPPSHSPVAVVAPGP